MQRSGAQGVLVWLAFALPLAWAGMTLAVATHEVIGHASTAIHSNFEVCQVRVGLDGTGHVLTQKFEFLTRPPSNPEYGLYPIVAIGLGGIISTAVVGFMLTAMAMITRRRTLLSCALLLVGLAHLLDAPVYLLRDLMVPGKGGDIDAILRTGTPGDSRLPLAVVGAVLLVAVGLFFSVQLFRRVEDRVGPLTRSAGVGLAAGLAPLITFMPLIQALHPVEHPGKWLPVLALLATQLIAGVFCVLRPRVRPVVCRQTPLPPGAIVLTGWITALVVAGAVLLSGAHRGIDFAPTLPFFF